MFLSYMTSLQFCMHDNGENLILLKKNTTNTCPKDVYTVFFCPLLPNAIKFRKHNVSLCVYVFGRLVDMHLE